MFAFLPYFIFDIGNFTGKIDNRRNFFSALRLRSFVVVLFMTASTGWARDERNMIAIDEKRTNKGRRRGEETKLKLSNSKCK